MTMPNEIDVKGLREKIAHHRSLPSLEKMANVTAICNVALNALPALLDEIERLREEVRVRDVALGAEVERDAALARVKELEAAGCGDLARSVDAKLSHWMEQYRDVERERDALKEKMEKVRDKALEWQAGPNVDYDWCGGRILAILGKEG